MINLNELLQLMKDYQNEDYGMGSLVSIVIFADGSGEIIDINDFILFQFKNTEELISHLKNE